MASQSPRVVELRLLNDSDKTEIHNLLPVQAALEAHAHARSLNFLLRDFFPYVQRRLLGKGGYATVYEIYHSKTKETYACKRLLKRYGEEPDAARNRFSREVDITQSLSSHHHMIKIFESFLSYPDLTGFMFMRPIADRGSLESFLSAIRAKPTGPTEDDKAILLRAIGCLTHALAWIHTKQVRHKDITPGNILVHNRAVVVTDFGISVDTSTVGTSTTGPPGDHNRRYSAPEVLRGGLRNRKSDVFSLGCVLVEIGSVFWPNTIAHLGTGRYYAGENNKIVERLSQFCDESIKDSLNSSFRSIDEFICTITAMAIKSMLVELEHKRSEAAGVWIELFNLSHPVEYHYMRIGSSSSNDMRGTWPLACQECLNVNVEEPPGFESPSIWFSSAEL